MYTRYVPPMAPPLRILSPDQDHETLFRFQSDLASVESNATHWNAITSSLCGQPAANCWLGAFDLTLIFNYNSHWSVSAIFQDLIQSVAFLDSFSIKLNIFLSFPWLFGVCTRNLTESLYLWVLEGDIKLLISFYGPAKKVILPPLVIYYLFMLAEGFSCQFLALHCYQTHQLLFSARSSTTVSRPCQFSITALNPITTEVELN